MTELELMVEAKARILLSNAFVQIEKFKSCELKDKIQLKIAEIFQLLDEHAKTVDSNKGDE